MTTKIIIQKFGGTSLKTKENRAIAAEIIKKAVKKGFSPVVIVSAIGRKGDPYSTDSLLEFGKEAFTEIDLRQKDLLLSCGEIISSVIMTLNLLKIGIKAKAFTGFQAGIITDSDFSNSTVQYILPDNIITAINDGFVPVIAGFQGITENGEITTLGRGGSDTTASLMGVALQAEFIEIYSDVAGIFSGDPGKIEKTELIKKINYSDVFEIASQGAKVIHPKAALIAMNKNIPIYLKKSGDDLAGTIISDIETPKLISAVTTTDEIIFVEIKTDENVKFPSELSVFDLLAKENISVDFINIRPEHITFIVKRKNKDRVKKVFLKNSFVYQIYDDFVKISVIGCGMTGIPGVMSRIVNCLTADNIKIYQSTDSHTTISCLIKKNLENKALQVLHNELIINK